jgi:uncharacterized membrane protein YbaN (DUF454 family)
MPLSKRLFWLIVRQTTGWGLIGLGIAGLLLPILPGWVLIGWGVITLAPDVPFFRRLLDRVERQVPQLKAVIQRMRAAERRKGPAPPD